MYNGKNGPAHITKAKTLHFVQGFIFVQQQTDRKYLRLLQDNSIKITAVSTLIQTMCAIKHPTY